MAMRKRRRSSLLLLSITAASTLISNLNQASSFPLTINRGFSSKAFLSSLPLRTVNDNNSISLQTTSKTGNEDNSNSIKPWYYKLEDDKGRIRWYPRISLKDLVIGQKLMGRKKDDCDLLDGKTGPKIFFECGVARLDPKGKWHIVNGMLRLGRSGAKASVTRKRAARLSNKFVELYVSRVRLENGHLEVCTSKEAAMDVSSRDESYNEGRVPLSSLKPGTEVVGTVQKVLPFGVLVDVSSNRPGLLHIQKVADLYRSYIAKEEGLVRSGLEKGAKIRLVVVSNQRKRLSLDFTDDVKAEAVETIGEPAATTDGSSKSSSDNTPIDKKEDDLGEDESLHDAVSEEDAAAWAAFAAEDYGEDYYYEDDEPDEDRAIEDALGLGSY